MRVHVNYVQTSPPAAESEKREPAGGVDLRDWFAGMVLAGMHTRSDYDPGTATPKQRASLAYIDADAMLKAREAKR